MSKQLAKCPFCGEGTMYEIQREDELGRIIPQLFCNSCKMIFEVENDSPYMSDEKTLEYLKEKLLKTWNTRKPMEIIVERLEECYERYEDLEYYEGIENGHSLDFEYCHGKKDGVEEAIEIVKEEGGMNE